MQSQKAVSAYLYNKQILPFGFAQQYSDDQLDQHQVKVGKRQRRGPNLKLTLD